MKIFVGNLSFETNDEGLRTAFAEHGTVDTAQIVTDRQTGRSRGFGFVEMPDSGAANKAISALNGSDLDGRSLNVDEAKPRSPRHSGRDDGRGRW